MTNTKKQNVIWRSYPDYPFIQANQFGEIRTVDHYTESKDGRRWLVKGHVLKQGVTQDGYLRVGISVNGKQVQLNVHRIVATCFLPNPNNLPEVNYKDCNRANNNVNNLEWCTREYNNAYKEKYGVPTKEISKVLRKPVFAVNLKTSEVSRFESQREAARQLGVNCRNINNVLKGRQKQTHGYWFCYADEHTVEKIRAKFGDEVASQLN